MTYLTPMRRVGNPRRTGLESESRVSVFLENSFPWCRPLLEEVVSPIILPHEFCRFCFSTFHLIYIYNQSIWIISAYSYLLFLLKGNDTFAAQVKSSYYYLLSSLHAEWPYGISPGTTRYCSFYILRIYLMLTQSCVLPSPLF